MKRQKIFYLFQQGGQDGVAVGLTLPIAHFKITMKFGCPGGFETKQPISSTSPPSADEKC